MQHSAVQAGRCQHNRWGLLRPTGIEFLALDSGPGMADVAASARERGSTTGTLVIGADMVARRRIRDRSWPPGSLAVDRMATALAMLSAAIPHRYDD
ncbi:hypothetical protein GA0115240_161250 [Streptomyces sp. DvalAA-14]|uniref:hypothetical protein n=1 Tax=unclassified Streptomyces TaxID=2593676 RepID=UPI00081B5FDF|nr:MULTISPECIES: hypothetical protein [unclassified Streptomyces]MYS24218.1 hypothetical protein [Streptomyces sp. SID4948]SCE43755.1 hypothetical protein GA0115240_161250 [Streptomyces sp. DvalAA-14]